MSLAFIWFFKFIHISNATVGHSSTAESSIYQLCWSRYDGLSIESHMPKTKQPAIISSRATKKDNTLEKLETKSWEQNYRIKKAGGGGAEVTPQDKPAPVYCVESLSRSPHSACVRSWSGMLLQTLAARGGRSLLSTSGKAGFSAEVHDLLP